MAITIETNAQQVQIHLDNLVERANSRRVLETIGATIQGHIRMGFRLGRSPWGHPWADLAIREGEPLRDTKRLQNSITYAIEGEEVAIGTNVCYAPVHQFGATIEAQKPSGNNVCGYQPKGAKMLAFPGPAGMIFAKKVKIPARPFLPLTETGQAALPQPWEASVLDAISKYIVDGKSA